MREAFLKSPRYKRTNKAVRTVRIFLQHHTKVADVKLGEELNSLLWARGNKNPPSRVTVTAKKEGDVIYAELAGKEFKKKDFAKDEGPKTKLDELKEKLGSKKETKVDAVVETKEATHVAKEEKAAPAKKEAKPVAKKAPAKKAAKK